jgi:hypothetical protein
MDDIITLQRNMDNGYGVVYCVQKQDFQIEEIHYYFQEDESFDSINSLVSFLEEKLENEEYDFLNEIMCDLDESDEYDHFSSTTNPNGYGNNVDVLVVSHNGEIIFEH